MHDSSVFDRLFSRVTCYDIGIVEGDGAYDSSKIREEIIDRGAKPIISYNPRRGKRRRKKVKIRRRWAVEHFNSRLLDILNGIYHVKGLIMTKLYACMASMAILSVAIGVDAIGMRDRIRSYRTLIVIMGAFWITLKYNLD